MPPSIPEPHLAQIVSWLFTPIVAIVAAIFAWIIAYRQWKTAQNRLKLDLFDRRFAVYDTVKSFLIRITNYEKITGEEFQKFLIGINEAKWLLNDEISNYLRQELLSKYNELRRIEVELESLPVGEEKSNLVENQSELNYWFRQQYHVLDQKFEPFLKLKH
jgi:phosphate/sulfate permease